MVVMEDEVKCLVKVACKNGSIVNTHGENPDWLLNREIYIPRKFSGSYMVFVSKEIYIQHQYLDYGMHSML